MQHDPYDHDLHKHIAQKLGLIDEDILLKLGTSITMLDALKVFWRNLVFWFHGPWRLSALTHKTEKPVADVQLGGFEAKIFCEIKVFKVMYRRWWVKDKVARLYTYSSVIATMPLGAFRTRLESPVVLPAYQFSKATKAKEEYVLLCCYIDTLIAKVAEAEPEALAQFKKSLLSY